MSTPAALPAPCCAEAITWRVITTRLLAQLDAKEKQLDAARREIAHLEHDLGRSRPRLLIDQDVPA